MINVITFEPKNEPQVVWSAGDVKVGAIRSSHIPGHASYRVDTPAGSVVIGGDAGNDLVAPPRATSTSDQVETLAKGVDIIVHTTMHPVMGPDRDSGMPPAIYYRQSNAPDLGALAKRVGAKHFMLTHMAAPLGTERSGPYKISRRPSNRSGLSESCRGGRIYWKHCRRDRSRKRPPTGEMNKVFDGGCPETLLLPRSSTIE